MKLEVRREMIPVVSDGTLGIPADVSVRKVPGPNRYFSDDVEITAAQFLLLAQREGTVNIA